MSPRTLHNQIYATLSVIKTQSNKNENPFVVIRPLVYLFYDKQKVKV